MSADGNTAVIGGPADSNGVGAAWVFARSGTIWSQQGSKIVGSASGRHQGWSVAISADGLTILVGGYEGQDFNSSATAWAFSRFAGTWLPNGILYEPGSMGDPNKGASVAVSADGSTAVVGDSNVAGGAWVFTRSPTLWPRQGPKLTSAGTANGAPAASVAISGDGNTVVVGGSGSRPLPGFAEVYTRNGGTWSVGTQLQGLAAAANAGYSVAISNDGSSILVGGPADAGMGAVWVFKRINNVWPQQRNKLTASDETSGGFFGSAVALSSDGSVAVIGANNGPWYRSHWVFTLNSAGAFVQTGQKLVASDSIGASRQGTSVATSQDGHSLITGGFFDNSCTPANLLGPCNPSKPGGAAWNFRNECGQPTFIQFYRRRPVRKPVLTRVGD